MYTLSTILPILRPKGKFKLKGESYTDLVWMSNDEKPSLQEVTDALFFYNSKEAKIRLQMERNNRLDECDWVVIRCFEKSESLPFEWTEYRENLRCLTENSKPILDNDGYLTNVDWPIRPKYITFNYFNLNDENEHLLLEDNSKLLLETSIKYSTREKSVTEKTSDRPWIIKGTLFD